MSSHLDDSDHVVYTRYQRTSWEDELIVGLFKDTTIIRRATISKNPSHDRKMNYTYFPNEVPRKCEFNHTLAANAVECKPHVEEGQETEVTFATVDRQINRGLLTRCIEVSSPKHNILAAERIPQRLVIKL